MRSRLATITSTGIRAACRCSRASPRTGGGTGGAAANARGDDVVRRSAQRSLCRSRRVRLPGGGWARRRSYPRGAVRSGTSRETGSEDRDRSPARPRTVFDLAGQVFASGALPRFLSASRAVDAQGQAASAGRTLEHGPGAATTPRKWEHTGHRGARRGRRAPARRTPDPAHPTTAGHRPPYPSRFCGPVSARGGLPPPGSGPGLGGADDPRAHRSAHGAVPAPPDLCGAAGLGPARHPPGRRAGRRPEAAGTGVRLALRRRALGRDSAGHAGVPARPGRRHRLAAQPAGGLGAEAGWYLFSTLVLGALVPTGGRPRRCGAPAP